MILSSTMNFVPQDLLSALTEALPRPTAEAPRNARGLYGLVDHRGDLRYIGSTSSTDQTLYQRIHQRHRTGSEGMSHYFSEMYNTGRMWRDRNDQTTKSDGDLAKKLRNEFIVDHCRAVWLQLPDTANIAQLEKDVLALAPESVIAWNRRRMQPYEEPTDLVDATLRRLAWGVQELAAIERQRQRYSNAASAAGIDVPQPTIVRHSRAPLFPNGPFRFFALDVETANGDRGSICQIGVACVRPDNTIETWVTYVDPKVDTWAFTNLHGISAQTVRGAPTFTEVLPVLHDALNGTIVYQHSSFDRSAIAAACSNAKLPIPAWDWRDSVHVARAAWPELCGNGGHGLGSLKQHLGLVFEHHNAVEDARAAAEVVLRAEGVQLVKATLGTHLKVNDVVTINVIRDRGKVATVSQESPVSQVSSQPITHQHAPRCIGTTAITQGNIDHNHIYLRNFFEKFPADAVGGSNSATGAPREIAIDWDGGNVVMTDLDGQKQFFRKRGWIRTFFERHSVRAGDTVLVEETAPYKYRLVLRRRSA